MSDENTRVASAPPAPRSRPNSVLIVEDNPSTAGVLTELLEGNGYQVSAAEDGAHAKALLDEIRPDLVILDLMLPDVDGLVLCADLKARMDVPIIVCSGTNRKRDGTLALRLGADDFVAKPFDMYDLEARVEAVLRRASRTSVERTATEPDTYELGDLRISRTRRQVSLGGKELQVTPTEYRLLSALASRPDDVLTRDELAQHVWGYEDASSGRAIDVHIRRLRMKLDSGPVPPPRITSVRGLGYKMLSEGQSANQDTSVA
jgi:two-component system response regulator MtrA